MGLTEKRASSEEPTREETMERACARSNGGNSAFPVQTGSMDEAGYTRVINGTSGLTKRELIAALVMQGECIGCESLEKNASRAVQAADTLLAELAKRPSREG